MGNNRKDLKTEMILRLALAEQLEQDSEILAFLPESEQKDKHIFSPAHEKKMRKIFRMAKRAEHRPVRRKRLQRAAACIVVFLGVSTVTISSVDAVRIPILSFFTDVKEKATQYQIVKREESPLTKAFAEYEPTYVPDGYFVENVIESNESFLIMYIDSENNQWYEFFYNSVPSTVSIDTEDAWTKETELNGNRTIIVEKNGKLRCTMYMDTSQITLIGTISMEEMEKVLISIK